MKKYLCVLLFLCLICVVTTSCSSTEAYQIDDDQPEIEENPTIIENVDVDLTALSSTMVYAEVFNIMTSPDEYMGKTIKMNGPYSASYFDGTGLYYHYVVIEDATACCQQGLEFIWNGDHIFPDDYPEESTKIEVTGVFGSYDEFGDTYYYLAVDDISIIG